MIRTQFIEEQLRHGRLDAKTLDNMFRRRIEEGANCSPFVSQAILATVKDVFSLAPEEANSQFSFRKFGGGSRAARRVKFPPANRS